MRETRCIGHVVMHKFWKSTLWRLVNVDGLILKSEGHGIFLEKPKNHSCVVISYIKCKHRRKFKKILQTLRKQVWL